MSTFLCHQKFFQDIIWNRSTTFLQWLSTIYLTDGRYTDIVNQTIGKTLNIVGLSNDVTIDLENKGRAFLIPIFTQFLG